MSLSSFHSKSFREYEAVLCRQLWKYANAHPEWSAFFDRNEESDTRPPVFLQAYQGLNLIHDPLLASDLHLEQLPLHAGKDLHRWFRSMKSSQALTESIFLNLFENDCMNLLTSVVDDDELPLMGSWQGSSDGIICEYEVSWLGEPRPTSIDVFFNGDYRVAVECKLTEREFGSCSRPRLKPEISEYCNGSYEIQKNRSQRCSLAEIGVKYWDFVPQIFKWNTGIDLKPCPLRFNYQLVRNVIAATTWEDGGFSTKRGHALVLYDARNPEHNPGGKAYRAFSATKSAIHDSSGLRRCSWQKLLGQLSGTPKLEWIISELRLKYGLEPI